MKASPKVIVFDFDGTIADSFDVFLGVLMSVTKRTEKLSDAELIELRSSTIKENVKRLGVKNWQIPKVLIKGRHELNRRVDEIKPFDGMREVLEELSKNYTLYILSTNSKMNIEFILKKYELNHLFTKIYANIGILGKANSLKTLGKVEGLKNSDLIYIGDEIRDLEASRKANIKFIAVSWGFSTPEILKAYKPDALTHKPRDLIKDIDKQYS
jgi:HAD superfamily hydrolase (TIGR01549 family)